MSGGEVGGRKAFVRNDTVVAERAASMALVVWAPCIGDEFVALASVVARCAVDLLHVIISQVLIDLCGVLLLMFGSCGIWVCVLVNDMFG